MKYSYMESGPLASSKPLGMASSKPRISYSEEMRELLRVQDLDAAVGFLSHLAVLVIKDHGFANDLLEVHSQALESSSQPRAVMIFLRRQG